ncbi:MAG: hypothetical protein M0007_03065 [Actinomycetota bacterium]|jgi:hypothetical protein|nr:hypothetical protein [Actinomycetota bacterium]
MTTDELIANACPRIRDLGWAFYFDADTLARGEELGLDAVTFYMLGRGGVLGDAEGAVVASAFGYFNPELVTALWDAGRAKLAPRQAGREYMACCQAFGRAKLTGLADLGPYCEAAATVVAAAEVPALSLFAAIAAEPLADDLPARAMQLTTVLRELRGSAHLVAVVASGLPASVAHAIQRPNDWGMFGWPGEAPTPTDEQRAALAAAEALTDRLVRPAYGALDEAGAAALVAGLDVIGPAITG